MRAGADRLDPINAPHVKSMRRPSDRVTSASAVDLVTDRSRSQVRHVDVGPTALCRVPGKA